MKATNKKGKRQTRTVSRSKQRNPEEGRPKGTLKRYPFDQTRIGFMLRYEMPVVYHLLKHLYATQSRFEPDWRVIDTVAGASKDVSYKKAKFKRYLEEYRENGVFCRRGKTITPGRKAYYEGVRRRKVEAYIRRNRRVLQKQLKENARGEPMLREIKNINKARG